MKRAGNRFRIFSFVTVNPILGIIPWMKLNVYAVPVHITSNQNGSIKFAAPVLFHKQSSPGWQRTTGNFYGGIIKYRSAAEMVVKLNRRN